jgi:hypothetical protein
MAKYARENSSLRRLNLVAMDEFMPKYFDKIA